MWLETKTWRQWGSGENKTCCVGADGCGGGGSQPVACCEKKYHPAMKWYQMVRCKMIRNNCVQIHCAICCLGLGMLHGIPFDFEFEWWHCVLSHCFHHSLWAERHVYAQQHWDVFYSTFESLFQYVAETGCGSPTDSTGSESNWPSLIGMGRYCLLDTLHWHVKDFSWIFWLQSHV